MDISKKLDDFENRWDEICKKLETAILTKDDAEKWKNEFRIGMNWLFIDIPDYCRNSETNSRVTFIKHKVDSSILIGQKNYREKIIRTETRSKNDIVEVIRGCIRGIPWIGQGIDALIDAYYRRFPKG